MTLKKSSKRPANTIRAPKKVPVAKTARRAKKVRGTDTLTRSNAGAEREISKLRAYQEQLGSEAPQGESDARASLI